VEKTNFTYSNCKARNLLRKLGTDANSSVPSNIVTASKIASRLLKVSMVQMDKDHVRTTKKNLRNKKQNTDSRLGPFESFLVTASQFVRERRLDLMECTINSSRILDDEPDN
jgi:hypothetical protein